MPPFDSASVSITAGPPAWVTIATRLPFRGFWQNMPATVSSSCLPRHRTMPALRNRASTATSLLAIAPVCELAARLPASDPPAFTAAIWHPFCTSERACLSSFAGFWMLSTYSSFTRELVAGSKLSSKYSRISSTPSCALLPTENTELNRKPWVMPSSRMNTAVAPEPVIKSIPSRAKVGIGWMKTPV